MTLDELDTVPDITAANPDGGAAKLDPDPISQDTHSEIDSLLDASEKEFGDGITQQERREASNDTTTLDDNLEEPNVLSGEAPPATPATPAEEPPKMELDPEIAAIPQPRNLSESNQGNWRKIQEVATVAKKRVTELESEVSQLRQQVQQPQIPEDYEELKKFRNIHDIKNDPEFQSRYDKPITSAKESIYGILRKNKAPDDIISQIEALGGPDKVDSAWWKENIEKMPMTDAERIKRGLTDIADLKEKQQGEIENAATNAEQILAQREAQSQEAIQREDIEIKQSIENLTKELPWARYQKYEDSMTPEQRANAEKHNANVADLESKFNSALKVKTPAERAAVAAAATFSHVLTNQVRFEQQQNGTLQAEVKRLTDELTKLKSAGKMPKQTLSTPNQVKSTTLSDRIKMNPSDAFDLGMDEAGE